MMTLDVCGPSAAVYRTGPGSSYSPGTTTTQLVGTAGAGGRVGGPGGLPSANGSTSAVLTQSVVVDRADLKVALSMPSKAG